MLRILGSLRIHVVLLCVDGVGAEVFWKVAQNWYARLGEVEPIFADGAWVEFRKSAQPL